jgi:outer membrane protein OmpA-like peptidoglycan-associated protein
MNQIYKLNNLIKTILFGVSLTISQIALGQGMLPPDSTAKPKSRLPLSNRVNVGINLGMMHYYGDLNASNIPLPSTRFGFGAQIRYHFTPAISFRGQLAIGSIEANDRGKTTFITTGDFSVPNLNRSLNFRSSIIDFSGQVMFALNNQYSNSKFRLHPYAFAGIGVFSFNPKGDLFKGSASWENRYVYSDKGKDITDASGNPIEQDGEFETTLKDWSTEGQSANPKDGQLRSYSTTQINFPVGAGIRIRLNRRFDIDFELGMRILLTDYIDDVGNDYPSKANMVDNFSDPAEQQMAWYISNPVIYSQESNNPIADPGSGFNPYARRGGRDSRDQYSFTSIGVEYKLGKQKDAMEWLRASDIEASNFEDAAKNILNPMMQDTDGDGVLDFLDQDNNTPQGTIVTTKGVPFDLDGDGIYDRNDADPYTPTGMTVNSLGMPADSDGDGVPDYRDISPNTPAGAIVNFKGQPVSGAGAGYASASDEAAKKASAGSFDAKTKQLIDAIVANHLGNIYFDINQFNVKSEYFTICANLAKLMKMVPEIKVDVIGFTDPTGNDEYNKSLSERRANSVKRLMMETFEVEDARLMISGNGESNLLSNEVSSKGYLSNRRVQFRIVY